ncbi:cytochrome c [Aequorivita sp. SDUM287046]|uniref:Cytochrome c n=1 Tax=Aequorivita aurantiaca TaxID=3053356 RepID=A0ABT8DHD7_9FLAO|nr:cytochrome c [Aequorivita aurantiaca]MDN3723366.1 cytochrome c [Aequorivita aurantiaca]
MKTLLNIVLAVVASISLVSCFNDKKPNYQYFPNMYEPVPYETYGEYGIFPNQQQAMTPPEHTVPRGYTPYDYENSTAGLELAKTELQSPYEVSEENLVVGSQLYTLYCAVCHGDKGDGKGILATREKFLGIPSFADPGRNIVLGGIYHVETYGLNAMGSYASQTSEKERWQIAMHVMDLKAALNGNPGMLELSNAGTPTDSTVVETNLAETNNASE